MVRSFDEVNSFRCGLDNRFGLGLCGRASVIFPSAKLALNLLNTQDIMLAYRGSKQEMLRILPIATHYGAKDIKLRTTSHRFWYVQTNGRVFSYPVHQLILMIECLRGRPNSSRPVSGIWQCLFSTTRNTAAPKEIRRIDYADSYAYNHARQRKAANISRQAVLKEQRAKAIGDPIRGITTPFIESLNTAVPQAIRPTMDQLSAKTTAETPDPPPPFPAHANSEEHLNHFLSNAELQKSLEFSRSLTEPVISQDRATADPQAEADNAKRHESWHKAAHEAVSRILSLGNANSEHRTRTNVQRIIDTFGRHNTDQYLKPKAPSAAQLNPSLTHQEPTPRAGPDTGSSEVQIGILTAKIHILADRYQGPNRMDKVNKRNLRLLLHRRQKLLKYMERQERGSERWHNMIQALGLTEATWKGQIAVN